MFAELILASNLAVGCLDETQSFKLYDVECCCTHNWCAPLPEHTVREVTGGYELTIRRGDHPKLRPGTYFIPHSQAKVSLDGRWHACGVTRVTCFWFVPGGV